MTDDRQTLEDVLAAIDLVEDRNERADLLIQFADDYREVPAEVAERPFPENHRIPYCESEAYVWVVPNAGGAVDLHFAVENPSGISAKALAGILQQTVSGGPADDVAAIPDDLVERIFRQNISMSKGMGLNAMIQVIRAMARNVAEGRNAMDTTPGKG